MFISGRELSFRMFFYVSKRIGASFLRPIGLVLTGSFSPSLSTVYQRIRTKNPKTYVQKIRYKMARDRRPLLTLFADKVAVRDYVEARIGQTRLSKVYSSAASFVELDWRAVPEEYVIKVNHGCRGLIIVTLNAQEEAKLPALDTKKPWRLHIVHPSALDKDLMREWIDYWMDSTYNWRRWKYLEWPYSQVRRKVFIEEFLGGKLLLARNIKVLCFHGQVASLILTHINVDGREEADARFDPSELGPLSVLSNVPIAQLADVVTDSAVLSQETDFVRVDWVLSARGPLFGEMTNFPAAGGKPAGESFSRTAEEENLFYASLWKVPRTYRELPEGRY